jgi:hypothetical protein
MSYWYPVYLMLTGLGCAVIGARCFDNLCWWDALGQILTGSSLLWMTGGSPGVASFIGAGNVTAGLVIAWLVLHDWWNRKGKSAARLLGAKTRAVFARMAQQMKPRLNPLPQPA